MSNAASGTVCRTRKTTVLASFASLICAFSMMAQAGPSASEYTVEIIEGPLPANTWDQNLPYTELTDISHNGLAVFYSESIPADATDYSVILYASGLYDTRSGEYTILGSGEYVPQPVNESGFIAYGINAPGALVGGEDCEVIDKKGNESQPIPVSNDVVICVSRGISSNGVVTGYTRDNQGTWRGFAFDTKSGSFEEFLPDPSQTIAQGITEKGEIVGGTGPDGDRNGFVRYPDASVRLFQVYYDGDSHDTRGRGISDDGVIVGAFTMNGGGFNGFVGRLPEDPADTDLVPDVVFTPEMIPECAEIFLSRINNRGVISGFCFTGGGYGKGLLLTPIPAGK